MIRPHLRNVLVAIMAMVAAMVALAAGLSLLDLTRAGIRIGHLGALDINEARHLNNAIARNLNQLLAVVFTMVAIAVPLTANMYSVKFLDFFIKDPVNAGVLGLVVFADLENTWTAYLLRDGFIPTAELNIGLVLVVVCFATLLPYLYYVFRFLHPNTLLQSLEHQIEDALSSALRHPAQVARDRARVAEGLEHIANVAIRSMDRSDRSTAIESVATLERLARTYWGLKERMPPAWFQAEQHLFLGFSSGAVEEFSASRSWVEMKLFTQFRLIMGVGVPRTHDLASSVAKTLRRLGLEPSASEDQTLREIVTEFFNTFVRMTLVARDPRSAFTVFDQYRLLAEALNDKYPALVLEIAFYFAYYGKIAREAHLDFVVEAVAHDLATLVRHAWQTEAPNRHKLLDRFLQYDGEARPPLAGVKKAQAILASYFLLAGQTEPARLIKETFVGIPPQLIETLRDDLLHVRREKYWEVNERRMNMDYVAPEQREILRRFLGELPPLPA